MLRYTYLGPGASWAPVAEYGDPAISVRRHAASPDVRQVLAKYSPYHNLDSTQTYPPALFVASDLDDRVHPGHARKMVAKMLAMDKPAYYLESAGRSRTCVQMLLRPQ